MKIAVIGTGYVGLVAGACFAEGGNDVICVDKDAAKIRTLTRGKMPIYEPGLEELVRRNRSEGRLTFTTTLAKAVRDSAIIFIAVGTPQGEDGSADLQHVLGVAQEIAAAMNGYKVSGQSTVAVGTSVKVREVIRRERRIRSASSATRIPQAWRSRGFHEARSRRHRRGGSARHRVDVELYSTFTRTGAPHHGDGLRQRGAHTYAANAMLATRTRS